MSRKWHRLAISVWFHFPVVQIPLEVFQSLDTSCFMYLEISVFPANPRDFGLKDIVPHIVAGLFAL